MQARGRQGSESEDDGGRGAGGRAGECARATVGRACDRSFADAIRRRGRPEPPAEHAPGVTLLAPNVLSVRHWDRLLSGRLLAPAARVDWARLLERTFRFDVLACAKCGGRLRVLGEVTDPSAVRLVLESLAMPTEAPKAARARDPTELQGEHDAG